MKSNKYDTLFLDVNGLRDLETLAHKEKLLGYREDLVYSKHEKIPRCKPKGYKNLLFLLMMYEHLDSSISDYTWESFTDEGIIKYDSCIIQGYGGSDGKTFGKKDNFDSICVEKAKEIARLYKEDLIKEIIKRANRVLDCKIDDIFLYNIHEWNDILDPEREDSLKDIFLKKYVYDLPGKYSLKNDFESIIDELADGNMRVGLEPKSYFELRKQGINTVTPEFITIDPTDFMFNLIDSIYCSKQSEVAYNSSIFRFSKNKKTIDDLNKVYLTQCRYISDLQIIPMPETINDVFRFRRDPNLISFRQVMNEWRNYVDSGEFVLANKMRKDLLKANNALEHLDKYKRINNHPVTICCKFVGSVLTDILLNNYPVATVFTAAGAAIESCVVNYIEDKYKWSLLVNN